MSYTNLRKKTEGFTIIEVLIVLAIAGLIMMVVFLAVPALQRNSRNTQRKNDVSAMLGAVQETVNNNNGNLNTITEATVESNVKFGFYDPAQVTMTFNRAAAAVVAAPTTNDAVTVANFAKCADATTSTAAGATRRSLVAMYLVETGGGTQAQCQEL